MIFNTFLRNIQFYGPYTEDGNSRLVSAPCGSVWIVCRPHVKIDHISMTYQVETYGHRNTYKKHSP